MVGNLRSYGRFTLGLRKFLHETLTAEQAHAIVRQRLEERERNFLRLVERGIYGYSRSPYLPLLRLAGCEQGDLAQMVRTRGLDATLRALREAGVSVSFEEFKGLRPICRGGRTIRVRPRDFDNPYLSAAYRGATSGTTGAGSRVVIDLEHLAAVAPLWYLGREAHGLVGVPTGLWRSILPGVSGVNNVLRDARIGCVPLRWFSPVSPGALRPSLTCRVATEYLVRAGRAFGVPIPRPEPVPLDRARVVAEWAARVRDECGACLLRTFVSPALRVSLAAQEAGIDLTGVTFMGGGEVPTPVKVQGIRRSGARWIPTYAFAEAGPVGVGCAQPVDGNDIHLHEDALALVQHARAAVDATEGPVDAFYFTTLLPSAPKILLNVESDDGGLVEARRCGCPLETYFPRHLRNIRSEKKLTSEGATVPAGEMVRILEEVLPARFGGSALDYQLVEHEDAAGFSRLILRVSPRVTIAEVARVRGAVLDELRRRSPSADLARATWAQADTLTVQRTEPLWTATGKLPPLCRSPHPRAAVSEP